jgi:predicted amidophosphoribosyltransferase
LRRFSDRIYRPIGQRAVAGRVAGRGIHAAILTAPPPSAYHRSMGMLRTFAARLTGTLRHALNEQDCFLCGMAASRSLCDACIAACPPLPDAVCPRCALPTSSGATCGRCLHTPPHFDATIAAFVYRAPIDQAVQAFKYGAVLGLGGFLSEALGRALHNTQPPDLIVPMPLYRRRLSERGFNQALELARPLLKLRSPLPTPHPNAPVGQRANLQGVRLDATVVQRIRDTQPQAGLPWDERARNIKDAFACVKPAEVAGLRVAVVDDVITTGASLNEMARTLKAAGAAHVSNWVVARTFPDNTRPA